MEAEEEENYQKPICTFYCTSTTMKKRISGIVVVVLTNSLLFGLVDQLEVVFTNTVYTLSGFPIKLSCRGYCDDVKNNYTLIHC